MSPDRQNAGRPEAVRVTAFLGVVTAVALVLHVYPAVRLLPALDIMSTSASAALGVVLAVAMVGCVATSHSRRLEIIGSIGNVWLGVIFQLFVWTAVGEILRAALWISDVATADQITASVILVWTATVLAGGLWRALGPVPTVSTDIRIPRLHPDLDGIRIVQITDTHLSPLLGRRWMARVVDQVNAIDAEIVCHTGDLADGQPQRRDEAVGELKRVAGETKLYITGNHEYFGDADYWARRMNDLGWTFLHNSHIVYRRGAGRLVLAGIDDPTGTSSGLVGHGPRLDQALSGVPDDVAVVLLAHQPKQARQAVEHGVDLQLAGHTHGGQMWPFHYLVRADQRYVSGLYSVSERTQLYVSTGTGFWGPPFRIAADPQIAVLTLRST